MSDLSRGAVNLKAPRCECGHLGELRLCRRNRGIAWRCPHCLRSLSKWIPHTWLIDIDISALPDWDAPANQRQREFAL